MDVRHQTSTEAHFKSNNKIVFDCKYHIVWTPKYRRSVLVDGIDVRLKELILAEAAALGAQVIELEVMPDHVRLLASIDPQFGVHRLVKRIKGVSSRVLRQEFPKLRSRIPSLWTNSYFVSTVGRAPLAVIKRYIENQKQVC